MDSKVLAYLRRVPDGCGVVTAQISVAAERGILLWECNVEQNEICEAKCDDS